MTEDTDLDRLFTHLSAEGRRRPLPDAHPAPEKLSAYLADELSPEEDDALQEHLAGCTLCTDLLLDLQRFLDPPEEDRPREGVADFETAAEWRELRGRMGEGEESPQRPPFRLASRQRVTSYLAAVLALAVAGLSILGIKLYGDLKAPRPAVHLFLSSTAEVRGSQRKELKLHDTPDAVSLTLDKSPEFDFTDYMAEISRKKDPGVRRVRGLRYQDGEGVPLLLNKKDLEPDMYKIVLLGLRGEQSQKVGTYELSVLP